ncbi:MAG: hypothetical protein F4Y79_22880 [Gemmatimonadetes bacterium]|nr:hypothetical protein [Gemmatimonadota bacterium]MXX12518.1 hypothetical protein [Gemmatimonadota bacterium]MXZ12271.1 hypothetical protein [Gemmatimonadota bacterium]MYB55865.1 hypothetical protein [Gemmatimonadota bacterium]MYF18515.1 hypothetical protein [Gemmatimonadota bacterium]
MTAPDGDSADILYEQVLDNARREIEDALAIIDELRQSIRQVEARVEAAQSIYNAVTARLNLEDELAEEEIHLDTLPPVEPPGAALEPSLPSKPPEPEEPLEVNEAESPSEQEDAPVLSEAERALISEHLLSKRRG